MNEDYPRSKATTSAHMNDDLACPNCGGTDMKIVIRDSIDNQLHIMAFCAAGAGCKIYPVLSAHTKEARTE